MIQISNISSGNKTIIKFTQNENNLLLDPDLVLIGNDEYYKVGNIWDCVGDVLFGLHIANIKKSGTEINDKRIVISALNTGKIESIFYNPEVLIKLLSKLREWEVLINQKTKERFESMNEERFVVEIPEFNPNDGGVNWNKYTGKSNRAYAHPLDSKIIKFLDNGAINGLFRNLIEMMSDSTYGPVVASGIKITDNTYPELNEIFDMCSEKLSIKRPYAIISPVIGGINAMAFGSDEEPYIVLSPLMAKTMNKEQLKFVIGHECGHVAMGHMTYHTVVSLATNFANAIPVIGPIISKGAALPLMAWSRRSEISADRAGLLCCDDVEVAKRTLLQITMPFMDATAIDVDDYVNNSEKYLDKGVLRRVNEFADAHPIIPKRIKSLDLYVSSEKYCKIHNKPFSSALLSDSELEAQIEKVISVL